MKEVQLDGLIFCPVCGGRPLVHTNSRNRFRIMCSHCHARTDWLRKADAIIAWYNMHFTLHANRFLSTHPQVKLHD